jgi:hypothetical protein
MIGTDARFHTVLAYRISKGLFEPVKPYCWSDTNDLLKDAREVTLIRKSRQLRNLHQRSAGRIHHQALRAPDAGVHEPSLWRKTSRVSKCASKLGGWHLGDPLEFPDADIVIQIIANVGTHFGQRCVGKSDLDRMLSPVEHNLHQRDQQGAR